MVEHAISLKAFGIFQAVIFLVVAGTLIAFKLRQRNRDQGHWRESGGGDVRAALRRTTGDRFGYRPTVRSDDAGAQEKSDSASSKRTRAALESALPTWTKETPAHEILGVHPAADSKAVEAAYKSLLKRYHPDRFASWGRGYQTRAHQVVLLLQEARDRMLGKKR